MEGETGAENYPEAMTNPGHAGVSSPLYYMCIYNLRPDDETRLNKE